MPFPFDVLVQKASIRILLPLFGAIALPLHAATFCVGSAGQLQSAVQTAEANNQSDDIRIRSGIYIAPVPDGFYFYPASNDPEPYNVTVSGGWNADCSSESAVATDTVLSGNLQGPVLHFRNSDGTFTVRNLTITGGYSEGVVLGALHFDHVSGFGLGVAIERVILRHNEGYVPLYVKTQGPIHVVGSLFHGNLGNGTGAGGARIISENGFNTTYINNNTFADNQTLSSGTIGGLVFENTGDGNSHINNNILWGNDNADLAVVGNVASVNDCGYNDISVYATQIACNGANVVHVDPGFADATLENLRLRGDSPLLNIGCGFCAVLPNIDLDGEARPQLGGYDLGAYEFPERIFANGFD